MLGLCKKKTKLGFMMELIAIQVHY